MKALLIGDIFGKPGRKVVSAVLPKLRKDLRLDFVIANCENLAHGKGITEKTLNAMLDSGVDFFTSGNHVFSNEGLDLLKADKYPLIRPANLSGDVPGYGYKIVQKGQRRVLIINISGRVFMSPNYNCPFEAVDRILSQDECQDVDYIFVDMHAEATSEKIAMKHFLDGRVTALYGTHTHVMTADSHITENKTAFITDLGMTGISENSVLGVKKDIILSRFTSNLPIHHEVEEEGKCFFNALLVTTEKKKYASKVEIISEVI